MISATALVFILIAVLSYFMLSKRKNIPPGPRRLPVIGNVHQMDRRSHLTIDKWAKEYGDIYSCQLVTMKAVVISDLKMLKEIFFMEAFSGRPDFSAFDFYDDGVNQYGLVNTDGEHWEQLRRFTLRQLRDFGFGKNSMESYIMDEVDEFCDSVKSLKGKPVDDMKDRFTLAVVNSLWTIISGKRYKQDDPKLIRLTKSLHAASNDASDKGGLLLLFMPWLRHVIPKFSGYTKFREIIDEFYNFFAESVTEHKESYEDTFTRDFIDVFLKEVKQTSDVKSAFYKDMGERQLISSIADLFMAGSDTTSTTLSWAILYLSTFPEVQKKLQKEIENVTGNSRTCSLSDRPSMPYAEAVLAETMRYSSIVPNGVFHRALVEKEFQGYTIPKDTVIIPNLYTIHRNPEIWGDPEEFRPERFLSPDGKTFKKHEALIPFLIGRRQCLGESLARDTLFLFLTNTFQKFHSKFNPDKPQTDLEPGVGFMLYPKPFEVVMTDRLV